MIPSNRHGFTLIELSIVLVIIGLIVGGVLVGQDLIHAAEIRSTVSQFEKYNAAVNTFRSKYNCLPGDCFTATQFGLGTSGGVGDNGNGDEIIGRPTNYPTDLGPEEYCNFWYHLAHANLVSGDYPGCISLQGPIVGQQPPYGPYISLSAQGTYHRAEVYVTSDDSCGTPCLQNGTHWFIITAREGDLQDGAASLMPADAFQLDQKMDDGLPLVGTVRAIGDIINDWVSPLIPSQGNAGANQDNCVATSTTPSTYNVLNTSRSVNSRCGLVIRSTF